MCWVVSEYMVRLKDNEQCFLVIMALLASMAHLWLSRIRRALHFDGLGGFAGLEFARAYVRTQKVIISKAPVAQRAGGIKL